MTTPAKPSGARRLLGTLLVAGCAYGAGLLAGRETLQSTASKKSRPQMGGECEGLKLDSNLPGHFITNVFDTTVVSAFVTGTNTILQELTTKVRELNRQGERNIGRYFSEIDPLLWALNTEGCVDAWNLAGEISSLRLREDFRRALVHTFSRKDPRRAVAAVVELAPGDERDSLLNNALWAWGEKESGAAIEWASKIPDEYRRGKALSSVVTGMARADPAGAARQLAYLPEGPEKSFTAGLVARELARIDPNAAAALLTGADHFGREIGLRAVAAARAASSLPEALAWAAGLDDAEDRKMIRNTLMSHFGARNPQEALRTSMAEPDLKERAESTAAVLAGWAERDLPAAAAWISEVPDDALRQRAWEGLRNVWIMEDPEGAAHFVLTSLPAGAPQQAALERLAETWTQIVWDDQAPSRWADQLPAGAGRDAFLAGLCRTLAIECPEEAARITVSMSSGGEVQAETIGRVIHHWVVHEPESASAWSRALSEGQVRTKAMSMVAETWAQGDPVAADEWLRSLPEDGAREDAAAAFVRGAAASHPDWAAQWIHALTDTRKRNQQMEIIARNWMKTDPEAARQWLEGLRTPREDQR